MNMKLTANSSGEIIHKLWIQGISQKEKKHRLVGDRYEQNVFQPQVRLQNQCKARSAELKER